MQSRFAAALAFSLPILVPALAQAGPPLVCWPMSIGRAPSLPWGSRWHDARTDYDRSRLAADTLALLGPDTRVLVRMETLRRAAVYAAGDDAAAGRLFEALRGRVTPAGDAKVQALARFDLGYEAEAYRQALFAARYMSGGSPAHGIEVAEDGYQLVHEALTTLRPDPEMEYAAALVSLDHRNARPLAQKHARMAADGTREDAALARTLAAHAALWRGALPEPLAMAAR